MDDQRTRHPSFGQLEISRVTCSHGQSLYGSALRHSTTIQLALHESEHVRSLNNNSYFPTKTIIEVEMSAMQFAEAISSLNMGSGVPVTIMRRDGKRVEDCPEYQEREQYTKEFAGDIKKSLDNAQTLVVKAKELCGQKSVTKGQVNELRQVLEALERDLFSNLQFVNRQFQESVDKAVSSAKHDIEAHLQMRIRDAGLESLMGKYVPPQIESDKA